MDVRLARPTDGPLVLALSLDDGAHIVRNSGWPATNRVAHTLLRSLLPLAARGRLWIAKDGADASVLEAAPRRYVIGWDVTRLAARGQAAETLDAVVAAATQHVQSRGVPRLFARCHEDGADALKRRGFNALAREYVLVGPEADIHGDIALPIDSRYRMPQDAWPLHQLESAITPPLVRQLEGLTSLDWSHKLREMSEILVEADGRVVAWVGGGAPAGQGLRQIGMLVDPEYRELAPDLLLHVLRNATPGQRFVARIRDYQPEVLATFVEAGFSVMSEEILMIKHAQAEVARLQPARQVGRVPSIQAFNYRLGKLVVSPTPGNGTENGQREE